MARKLENQWSRKGVFLVDSFYTGFYILLGLGLFILGVSTNFVTSYFWGEEIWPGTFADCWGARVYLGYYTWRNLAISLLSLACLVFILLMFIDARKLSKSHKETSNLHLYTGLLLPSLFLDIQEASSIMVLLDSA